MALEGKAPKKGGKSKSGKGGAFSMADVDSMLAGIGDIGEGDDDDEDMSDIDDEALLGELQVHMQHSVGQSSLDIYLLILIISLALLYSIE